MTEEFLKSDLKLSKAMRSVNLWERGETKFSIMTTDELRKMLAPGAVPLHPLLRSAAGDEDKQIVASLPNEFDWRTERPECMSAV